MRRGTALGTVGVGLAAVAVGVMGGTPPVTAPGSGTTPAGAASGRPLAFEPNRGQTDPAVAYLARGPGYHVYVTSSGAVLALAPAIGDAAVVRIRPAGGNSAPAPGPVGRSQLPGVVNVYAGHDPARWLEGIPTFGAVEVGDVYPGVDLLWHGSEGHLEYDFVVAPGADPAQIRVAVEGVGALRLSGSGELILNTAAGELVQRPPVAYQVVGGVRRLVPANYVLEGPGEVGFHLGTFDRRLPLVIDPVIAYSTFLGGAGTDAADDIAIDAAKNVYLTGRTASTDFPATAGLDTTRGGLQDAFVTKLTPTGAVSYSTYLGGGGFENSGPTSAIAVDTAGNAYVTGTTTSTDFPATPGLDITLGPPFDAFVTKLGPAGAIVYSTYLGGGSGENGNGIAVDASFNAYITGSTASTDFPATPPLDTTLGGGGDAFVTKLGTTGSISYSTFLGGSGDLDAGFGIAVYGSDVYVTGDTKATDFPTTAGLDATLGGTRDAFVTKLGPSGTITYSSYLGGGGEDLGRGIAVGPGAVPWVIGTTASADFPTTAGLDTTLGGGEDVFVTKFAAGGTVSRSTFLGGSGFDEGAAIAVDAAGYPSVTGQTFSADFPTTPGMDSTRGGATDAFVTRLTPMGVATRSTYLGGAAGDGGAGIAVAPSGEIYVAGQTDSGDFPATAGLDTSYGGGGDGFVTKLSFGAPLVVGDFNTDGDTDVAVFRPSTSVWYLLDASPAAVGWGTGGDIPVPGDYDGDGKGDVAVFRPSAGVWFLATTPPASLAWGASGDIPVPGDYDGDGKTDLAVFRPSTGVWYLRTASPASVAWGSTGDIPVPGDYDGDGKTDLAVFRPATGVWYLRTSSPASVAWGSIGDIPVPGDYDGDGTIDLAAFRPSTGVWYVRTATPSSPMWGATGDVPVPADYDRDGRADLAVFRPSAGVWYVLGSTAGGTATSWGATGDVPLPLPDAIRRSFFTPL